MSDRPERRRKMALISNGRTISLPEQEEAEAYVPNRPTSKRKLDESKAEMEDETEEPMATAVVNALPVTPATPEFTAAAFDAAMQQLRELQRSNANMWEALQHANRQLARAAQVCCGCGSPFALDAPRLLVKCCKRPVCADCQAIWVCKALELTPTIPDIIPYSFTFALGLLECGIAKSYCCFTEFEAEVGTIEPNPAQLLFTSDDDSYLTSTPGPFPRCQHPGCTQREIQSSSQAAAHPLLLCTASNAFRCPFCRHPGSLSNVNNHLHRFERTMTSALLAHLTNSCPETMPCSRCGEGNTDPHRLGLHMAEDMCISAMGKFFSSLTSLQFLIKTVKPTFKGLNFLANTAVDALAKYLILAFSDDLLANSFHRSDIDRVVLTILTTLHTVKRRLRETVNSALATVQHSLDSVFGMFSGRVAVQYAVSMELVRVELQTGFEAAEAGILQSLKLFAKEILYNPRVHEGAMFLPVDRERAFAATSALGGAQRSLWYRSDASVRSCLPAVGWLVYRWLEVLSLLNEHKGPMDYDTEYPCRSFARTPLDRGAYGRLGPDEWRYMLRDSEEVLRRRGYDSENLEVVCLGLFPQANVEHRSRASLDIVTAIRIVKRDGGPVHHMPLPPDVAKLIDSRSDALDHILAQTAVLSGGPMVRGTEAQQSAVISASSPTSTSSSSSVSSSASSSASYSQSAPVLQQPVLPPTDVWIQPS